MIPCEISANVKSAVFRVDSSPLIGTGHVRRCIVLADALRQFGVTSYFLSRTNPGDISSEIESSGHILIQLPRHSSARQASEGDGPYGNWLGTDWATDAAECLAAIQKITEAQSRPIDLMVVDHYALDARWDRALRALGAKMVSIDDLGDRGHDCDILLNQNAGWYSFDYKGKGLVAANTLVLGGPRFALLRPEFRFARARRIAQGSRYTNGKRLLISMGGGNTSNVTKDVISALMASKTIQTYKITIVVGSTTKNIEEIRSIASLLPCDVTVIEEARNMGELLESTHLAIGAGGVSALERCCVGVPSIIVPIADNQLHGGRAIGQFGGAISLESVSDLPKTIDRLSAHEGDDVLADLSLKGFEVTDGSGAIHCALHFLNDGVICRQACSEDVNYLYHLFNDSDSLRFSLETKGPVTFEAHRAWFEKKIGAKNCEILICCKGNETIGQVRFEQISSELWELDYAIQPNKRGAGLSIWLLFNAIEFFVRKRERVKLLARVKQDNIRSLRALSRIGFINESNVDGVVIFKKLLNNLI